MVLRNQGIDVGYAVRLGRFDLTDGKLDVELELEIVDRDEEEAPPEILVRLANVPFMDRSETLHVRDRHHEWVSDDGQPHAFVYSGFHHARVTAWVDVLAVDDSELTADIKVVTDDVVRYDEAARDSHMRGHCVLSRHPRNDMWMP